MKYIYFSFSVLLLLLSNNYLWAQPSNNDCYFPIQIPAASNWCSNVAEYTNIGATPSGYGPATCFPSASNDVWFSFVATGTDITITVRGNQAPSPGGTLTNPQVALYLGTCGGTINQLQCETSGIGSNIAELYKGGLIIGQTYLVRVQGGGGTTGTFQLCVNSYNAPAEPGSDCVSASILCDKSPFVVQSVTSAGSNPDEASGSCLGGFGTNSESNSTWFKWTCDQPGTLTFTLTPNNAPDDLDFVVYELPGGLNDCSGKNQLRCMAAGDWNYPSPCMGPTGLNMSSTDISEQAGCLGGNDSYVKYIDMVSGKSYALLVNNFSETGNGFAIEFGGTGTFQGPTADLTTSSLGECAGQSFTFNDNSSFPFGSITNRTWSFGVGAQPGSASGTGPHGITYQTPGQKAVTLTVETDKGCIVTAVEFITVDSCCENVNAISYTSSQVDVLCRDDNTGSISVNATNNNGSSLPFSYNWSTGISTSNLTGLGVGTYMVTISNSICEDSASFVINGPPAWDLDYNIDRPTCDGGTDGAIQINNVSGSNGAPYQYNWENTGFGNNTSYTNLSNGIYNLVIQDSEGCDTSINFDVHEIILDVDYQTSIILDPSCYNYSNGYIEVEVLNGLGPFEFTWSTGDTTNYLENLPQGVYILDTIWDANRCRTWEPDTFNLVHPDTLVFTLDSVMVSCFGDTDGQMLASTTGGTLPYNFSWSHGGGNDSLQVALAPGYYELTVTDANSCTAIEGATIDEPPQMFIDSVWSRRTTCYGYSDGQLIIFASGGRVGEQGYTYAVTPQENNFQTNNTFLRPAGEYTVYAQDTMGCTESSTATVVQPYEITVDAGEDYTIELGEVIDVYAELGFVDYFDYDWYPNIPNNGLIDCDTCRGTEIQPHFDDTYYIQITNIDGCTAIDSMQVKINKPRDVFIPNAFSPNGDGVNELLLVYTKPSVQQIKDYKIFDRWGTTVYHQTNIPTTWTKGGWDGRYKGQFMNTGVFVYMVEVEFIDGHIELFVGDVTLLR
ncbi:MAG: gliding motility-associated C-terminal domain-containing protein [Saprospiraceae bacterium]|nr:gliding motility-associated C-terminal domain-containing protein [Saprospiraceae bacterium]